jgi:hypothetical protein
MNRSDSWHNLRVCSARMARKWECLAIWHMSSHCCTNSRSRYAPNTACLTSKHLATHTNDLSVHNNCLQLVKFSGWVPGNVHNKCVRAVKIIRQAPLLDILPVFPSAESDQPRFIIQLSVTEPFFDKLPKGLQMGSLISLHGVLFTQVCRYTVVALIFVVDVTLFLLYHINATHPCMRRESMSNNQ